MSRIGYALERWYWNHCAAWCVLFRRRDLALNCYQKMLAANPKDAVAAASLGFQYAQLNRKPEALAMFDRVVELDPNNAEAHFNRGFLLQERNDPEGAMIALRRALEINPNHDRALYGLALSLIGARRLEEAVPLLKRNTKLQPMSPYGWYQLARVELELGHPDKTQEIINHLNRFEPKIARQLERETGMRAQA